MNQQVYLHGANHKKSFEVYAVYEHNTNHCLYVGSGALGRHEHASSGASHNVGLNRDHFSGVPLDIYITPMDSKEDSLQLESVLINLLDPEHNSARTKKHMNLDAYVKKEADTLRLLFIYNQLKDSASEMDITIAKQLLPLMMSNSFICLTSDDTALPMATLRPAVEVLSLEGVKNPKLQMLHNAYSSNTSNQHFIEALKTEISMQEDFVSQMKALIAQGESLKLQSSSLESAINSPFIKVGCDLAGNLNIDLNHEVIALVKRVIQGVEDNAS